VQPDVRPGIVLLGHRRLVIADLIAPGTTNSNVVQFMKETTFTNAAAPVAQGATKPESTLVYDSATSPVQKIAHWIPVTEEMLEDFAQTRSVVDSRLRFGLELAEDDQLLNGNGVSPNLLGLMNLTGLTADQARGADTNMDAIAKQIATIASTTFIVPDAIVVHPNNALTMQLAKTTTGEYLAGSPFSATAGLRFLWGLPLVATPAIAANTALVGAFQQAAQVFRHGGVRVEASNSHSDFFVKNLVAIRAEERLALAVYREAAFGKVTGLN
jgi:HK97 family phage major capsid protein